MAKARCEECGVPNGYKQTYSKKKYLPVGHPHSGIVCGIKSCRNPGLAWLNLEDESAYTSGERIFYMDTGAAKIQVQ